MKRLASFLFALIATVGQVRAGHAHLTTIYSGTNAYPTLLAEANGTFYFAADNPSGGRCGSIYSLQPPPVPTQEWVATLLYGFGATIGDACGPNSVLVPSSDGSFYGVSLLGGSHDTGAFYRLVPPNSPGEPWSDEVLYSFNTNPGTLLPGPAESFYTLTDEGTAVQLSPPTTSDATWTALTLYTFGATRYDALGPDSLIPGSSGVLYGTSVYGGHSPDSFGTVFELAPPNAPGGAWTETVLHSFGRGRVFAGLDNPSALALAEDGTLYGVATGGLVCTGCSQGEGGVFALSPPSSPGGEWGYTVLRTFDETIQPDSTIIERGGNLFFAARSSDGGYIFELTPLSSPGGSWTTSALHRYTNNQAPFGLLYMNNNAVIFGATGALAGSGQAGGTIFMITGITP